MNKKKQSHVNICVKFSNSADFCLWGQNGKFSPFLMRIYTRHKILRSKEHKLWRNSLNQLIYEIFHRFSDVYLLRSDDLTTGICKLVSMWKIAIWSAINCSCMQILTFLQLLVYFFMLFSHTWIFDFIYMYFSFDRHKT